MRYKIILLILSLSFFLSLAIFVNLSSPPQKEPSTQVFVINKGDSLDLISRRLANSGLIKNRYIFKANSYILGLHNKLRAGHFNLDPSMSAPQIIQSLVVGGSEDVWIKITEGWRNEEIARYLDENNFYSGKSFLLLTQDKQGQIFPDTYSIPRNKDLEFFIQKTLENFNQKYKKAENSRQSDFNQSEIVTVASLLEREANNLEAKQMVAGIIYNRLSAGMALQIDATVQYAKDSLYPPKKYWQPIDQKDLSILHPYNTYQNFGLPPGPICNPSYNSIYASLNPTISNYLYYITGKDGQMYYATTLKEHNQNIASHLR